MGVPQKARPTIVSLRSMLGDRGYRSPIRVGRNTMVISPKAFCTKGITTYEFLQWLRGGGLNKPPLMVTSAPSSQANERTPRWAHKPH